MMSPGTGSRSRKKVMVALQGGGAHTAYVWGVMDELLASDDIDIVALGGTSGGAMVAAVVAGALSMERSPVGQPLDDRGRRQLARDMLRRFWSIVAQLGERYQNPYRFVANPFHPSWNIDGLPVPVILSAMSLLTSPYQSFTGIKENPVVEAILESINLDVLNKSTIGPALYVCATNVRTGQPAIFTRNEIRTEHLLASACLPTVDRAIQIGGEYYWDGGYVSDPSLAALIRNHCSVTGDLIVVGVNPIVMKHAEMPPNTAWGIVDRMNEVTFNASLISELRQIHTINELLQQVPPSAPARQKNGRLHGKKDILIHYIPPHESMAQLGVASKNNTAKEFLEHLEGLGKEVARQWKSGDIAGGGASLLGISSDTNFEALFIRPQHGNAAPVPSSAPYLADGGHVPAETV
ncbi:patatin-like phospholipase family protein [Noviherbaspirillum aerium]|uniref:patatin-like phospholipase family protein n=1 Tax=Noviherbaspirillum aerium TaxID=2588497 RepID=UPI00124E838B|nr:patatin-like phospholipase family protein [Noviherbaspirillum aerium]